MRSTAIRRTATAIAATTACAARIYSPYGAYYYGYNSYRRLPLHLRRRLGRRRPIPARIGGTSGDAVRLEGRGRQRPRLHADSQSRVPSRRRAHQHGGNGTAAGWSGNSGGGASSGGYSSGSSGSSSGGGSHRRRRRWRRRTAVARPQAVTEPRSSAIVNDLSSHRSGDVKSSVQRPDEHHQPSGLSIIRSQMRRFA